MKPLAFLALSLTVAAAPASGETWSSSSSSSSSSSWGWPGGSSAGHLNLESVPLVSAVEAIERLGPKRVVLSDGAAAEIAAVSERVTLRFAGTDQAVALRSVLKGTALKVEPVDSGLAIIRQDESSDKAKRTSRSFAFESRLDRVFPIQLFQTPATMAASMIGGMTGLSIRGDALPHETAMFGVFDAVGPYEPSRMVTLSDRGRPLREVLEDFAQQLGAKLSIHDGWVEVNRD